MYLGMAYVICVAHLIRVGIGPGPLDRAGSYQPGYEACARLVPYEDAQQAAAAKAKAAKEESERQSILRSALAEMDGKQP